MRECLLCRAEQNGKRLSDLAGGGQNLELGEELSQHFLADACYGYLLGMEGR
jgi:hypothetical protein